MFVPVTDVYSEVSTVTELSSLSEELSGEANYLGGTSVLAESMENGPFVPSGESNSWQPYLSTAASVAPHSALSSVMLSLTASLAASSQLTPTFSSAIDSVVSINNASSISDSSSLRDSSRPLSGQFPECPDEFIGIVNFTEFNFPGTVKAKEFGWDEYFKILLYLCAIMASLFGNLAVVVAVWVKRTLRVTVNLYLANLAVADILICVCCMWVHLVNHLTAPKYVLGPLLCKFNGFAQMTCLTSSVLILSAISCDRYMAIMFPLRSRVTKQRTGTVIFSIWIFSLFISLPFFFYRRLQTFQWSDYTETNCMEAWPAQTIYSQELGGCVQKHIFKRVYYTLVSTTLFFAPVLIMLTAYSAIIWKLWVNKVPGEAHYANIRQQKKSKRKVIQMVVVVLLVFVICWLPLQMVVLYSLYVHSTEAGALPEWFPKLSYYSTFIAYSNSAFNPLIYGGFNKNFRDALCNNAFCSLWWKGRRLKRPQYSSKSLSTVVTSVNRDTPRNNGTAFNSPSMVNISLGEQVEVLQSNGDNTQMMVMVATNSPASNHSLCHGEPKVKTQIFELETFACSERDSFL